MNELSPTLAAAPPLDAAAIRQIVIGVMVAMLLAAIDQTIVATALPTIGRDLGDAEHLPWVVTAYLLSATAVTPLYGKLSDIYGRRPTLLIAILIFMVGSVFCAIAPTMLALILARFLQGLGGGALISLAQTIVGDIIAPKERPKYQAYFASVFVTASVLGPIFGGFFAEHLHWSMIFWINLPLGLLALFMTYGVLRRLPRHERPHRLDVVGALLMVVASVAILLALTWGGIFYPWNSPFILGLIGASLVAWALFAVRLLTAVEPFVPLAVLFDQVVACCTVVSFFGVGTIVGLSIYVPIYFESAMGLTSSQSGFALIAFMAGGVTGATISGRVMARSPRYKRPAVIGLAVAIVAMSALASAPAGMPLWGVEILLAIAGIGTGTIYPVTTVSIQNAVLPHQMGTATATLNFFRSLGSAFLVAGFGAIFLAGLDHSGTKTSSLTTLLAEAMSRGSDLTGVFRAVFFAAAVTLAVALVMLIAMEERPLRSAAHPG
jgi:EmrB/QacA subfamily drug resistance transporter